MTKLTPCVRYKNICVLLIFTENFALLVWLQDFNKVHFLQFHPFGAIPPDSRGRRLVFNFSAHHW